jgi:ketosteroid isomerase-like protein
MRPQESYCSTRPEFTPDRREVHTTTVLITSEVIADYHLIGEIPDHDKHPNIAMLDVNQKANSTMEEILMSPKEEVRQINEQIVAAASKGDFAPFVNALDDGVEVFDHVAYLFENKGSFLDYLQSAVAGAESTTYTFHQSSYRAVTDSAVVVNAYDRLTTFPKGGGMASVQCGRATWVYARKGSDWKIVSAHFSPLPKE